MDFSSIRLITFDCYGTLIDWEAGMLTAFRQVLPNPDSFSDNQLLETYAAIESRLESGPYLMYREVLTRAARELGRQLGVALSDDACRRFAGSVKDWQPFPDTVEALHVLATRFRLGIISNVDDDLFAATRDKLQAPFDFVVTAQQVKSYKPALRNFHEAITRSGSRKEEMLHAAQSIHHDIVPAKELGLANAWVNRRFGKNGFGATIPAQAQPMLEVHSLAELAERLVS